MKITEPGQWQRTSPLAILFFFGKLLKLIGQNAWQSIAPFAAFIFAYEGELVTKIVFAVIAFFIISTSLSVLNYWFFRFQLIDDSILIRQGVVKKTQLDIKFDRIQGINTQQNVVFRYFGLVTVNLDTAGSSGNEGNLPAVTREFADSLRRMIGKVRNGDDGVVADARPDADALLSLDSRDLIRIGLADRRALIVFAVLSPLIERMDDNVYKIAASYVDEAIGGAWQTSIAAGAVIATSAALAVIALLALISIGAAFLRYHNFQLFLEGDTLRSHGGLLTSHELSMNLGKIQTLRLEQGIVMRCFSRYRLSGRQARSSQKQGKNKNFIIPLVNKTQANHLREILLAPEGDDLIQIPTSPEFIPISPNYMRTRFLLISLLPTVVGLAVFSNLIGPASLVFLLWLSASSLLIYQNWRRAGYHCSSDGFVRRSGFVGYRTVALLYRKVQRV
ncbi:MAG: PH domain-containing protein, partial [Gammaproteobacteria bacterium]|nr:PH domain-containing protein [Gammaproteobacteria bacterium]